MVGKHVLNSIETVETSQSKANPTRENPAKKNGYNRKYVFLRHIYIFRTLFISWVGWLALGAYNIRRTKNPAKKKRCHIMSTTFSRHCLL